MPFKADNSTISPTPHAKVYFMKNIVVFGANGAIGNALIQRLSQYHQGATIYALSRNPMQNLIANVTNITVDYLDENQLAEIVTTITQNHAIDGIIIAIGILHDEGVQPEKSLRHLSAEHMHHIFTVNTVVPALALKHFVPHLHKTEPSFCAVLSARIGSISDNRLGGWYSYRLSKSALNMMLKNTAIEIARTHPHAIIVGLHPGTVDSPLSKPFQNNIPNKQLFTPDYSAEQLLSVIEKLTPSDTGKIFAWDGKEITP